MVDNNQAKLPWDFQIQKDKVLMANQPDTVVADKQRRKVVIIDVAIHGDSKIREKEDKELQKYRGLREDLEKRLRVTVAIVVPVVIRALWAATPADLSNDMWDLCPRNTKILHTLSYWSKVLQGRNSGEQAKLAKTN